MSDIERFKTNVARALGIPNSIAAHMTPETVIAEAQKLRTRLQGRPRPVGKPRRGAVPLAGDPFARVVATCEAACVVADTWWEKPEPMLWARIAAEAPELAQALDKLETVTRTSTLRKVRP
jgi:hypothetical protein